MIADGILRFESLTIAKHSRPLEEFLSGLEPSIEQALCWLITEGGLPKCAEIIGQLPENDPKVHLINQTLLKVEEGEDSDMRGQLEGLL